MSVLWFLERVWMVQTEQQYICIHQCLLAVLEGKENIVGPAREIHDNEGYEGKIFFGIYHFFLYLKLTSFKMLIYTFSFLVLVLFLTKKCKSV